MGRLPLSPEVGYVGLSPVKHGGVSIDFQRGALTTMSAMEVRASSISALVWAAVVL